MPRPDSLPTALEQWRLSVHFIPGAGWQVSSWLHSDGDQWGGGQARHYVALSSAEMVDVVDAETKRAFQHL